MDSRFPALKRKVEEEKGVLLYEDEASFKVSGSVSRTWQIKGKGKGREVKFKAGRESAKVFGAVSAEGKPKFHFRFVESFNAATFLAFMKQIVRQYHQKVFIVLDNARYHHAILLQEWLEANKDKVELVFLPPYSPKFNAQECVWRLTRRKTTHNRYFAGKKELKSALFRRFNRFQGNPKSLSGIMSPFLPQKAGEK